MTSKRAFTLVEILVVVVIIGLLVTIVAVAVSAAQKAAQRAKISVQMGQIAMALDKYKAEIGEYPPDMFDDDALVRHVRKRWPRIDSSFHDAKMIKGAINAGFNDVDTNDSFSGDGAQLGALAFWLGGFPDQDGTMRGFNADPENPFFSNPVVDVNDRVYDKKVFIDLQIGEKTNVRLVPVIGGGGDVVPVIGTEVRGLFVPFVYFKGRADGGSGAYLTSGGDMKQFDLGELGRCVPYADKAKANDSTTWLNPTTFQLIHAGLDAHFGTVDGVRQIRPETPAEAGIVLQDLDNITNFSDLGELKSILP